MKQLGRSLQCSKKEKESRRFILIGSERIRQGHKALCEHYFSPSLKKVIFRINCDLGLLADVLVKSSRNRHIFHIWSADRINEILNFANEEASNRQKKGYMF